MQSPDRNMREQAVWLWRILPVAWRTAADVAGCGPGTISAFLRTPNGVRNACRSLWWLYYREQVRTIVSGVQTSPRHPML